MSLVQLGLWLLRRERASGEWRVLLLALVIGVGSVSTTGFLGDRLQRAMSEQGAGFLGADVLVSSPRPVDTFPPHTLSTSQGLEFASMVSRGEAFQLVSLRAVDAAYPLRGAVRIADQAGATGHVRRAQPPQGSVYADPQLLGLLNAQVGDDVTIGQARFRIAGLVLDEPGRLGGVFGFAPRVLMRADEVDATRVVQPGSRVTYLYQFAGPAAAVASLTAALKPKLDATQRLSGAKSGVEALNSAFARTDRYIQLTGLVSLLLSVVAIAMAAHRYAWRHYDQAALLRCLGATAAQLRTLYVTQLLVMGLLGSALGVVLGALVQQVLAGMVLPGVATVGQALTLPMLSWTPVAAALASGLLALAGASLPALVRLVRVSPLRVLRRDLPPLPLGAWLTALMSGSALLGLIAWYAGDVQLVGFFVAAIAAAAVVLWLLGRLALLAGGAVQRMAYGPMRFGLAQLLRHRLDSSLQLAAFTLALFLLALLALVRSDLVASWRQQLPPDAPNHFLVNIAPEQRQLVADYLEGHGLKASELYPVVRGRLVSKNGAPMVADGSVSDRDSNTLRRELNLTWTAQLPSNNEVVAGQWLRTQAPSAGADVAEISVEAGMATRLKLALGDELGFQSGDQTLSARITSIRRVKWDSMQPNFYVIFSPGQIDHLPASYLASVYVPAHAQAALPGLLKQFPGITVLALDKLIANIEAVFDQVIAAIELLLGFLLAAGVAVVVAAQLASLDARQHEAVLLRTLGAPRAWLAKGLWAEFATLGAVAGVLASVCAEAAMAVLGERLFDLPFQAHPWVWLALPVAGALLVGTSGWLTTRHITRVSPMQSLRMLA